MADHTRESITPLIDIGYLLVDCSCGVAKTIDMGPAEEFRANAWIAEHAQAEAKAASHVAEEIRLEIIKSYTEGSADALVLSDYDRGLADAENCIAEIRDRYAARAGGV